MKKNIFIILILSLVLVGTAIADTPPDPTLLTSDTSQSGHVVWSWVVGGSTPVTNSYNVSVDSIWHNSTTSTSYDDNIGSGATSTIIVWAYNNTGNLSTGYITGSQRGVWTLSSITDVIEGIIPLFSSLINLVIAIVPLTIVMIVVAGLAVLINKAFSKVMK